MHPVLIHLSGTERLGEFNLSAPGQVREVMKHYQRYLHVLPLAVSRKDMARNGAVDFDLALCRCSKKDSSYVVDSCWFRFTWRRVWDRMRILRQTQLRCGEIVAMTIGGFGQCFCTCRFATTVIDFAELCHYSKVVFIDSDIVETLNWILNIDHDVHRAKPSW